MGVADRIPVARRSGELPNFFILGAAKSGTTSLWQHLRVHPEVFMSPIKEPSYFLYPAPEPHPSEPSLGELPHTPDLASYRTLFADVGDARAVGEASAEYFANPAVPPRLRASVPDTRLIILLRDPVDRAYSAYLHQRREGREPAPDFRSAVKELLGGGDRRLWSGGYQYLEASRYYPALCRWLEFFPRNQMWVDTTDDLMADPVAFCQKVFAFLGVDDAFVPDVGARFNTSGLPRNRWVHDRLNAPSPMIRRLAKQAMRPQTRRRVHERLRRANLRSPPLLDRETRAWLLPYFRDDIRRVEAFLGRDLSGWRTP